MWTIARKLQAGLRKFSDLACRHDNHLMSKYFAKHHANETVLFNIGDEVVEGEDIDEVSVTHHVFH